MVREIESKNTLKFLSSYGGKILPRSTDGNLRYVGGLTRVLSVDRSISFTELMVKLGEFCGYSVTLRCQLPNGDLETLISIKSDDDLINLIEEYDLACRGAKIRAILSPPKSLKQISPPPSTNQSFNFSPVAYRYVYRSSSPPIGVQRRSFEKACYYHHVQGNPRISYSAPPPPPPHSNYWH